MTSPSIYDRGGHDGFGREGGPRSAASGEFVGTRGEGRQGVRTVPRPGHQEAWILYVLNAVKAKELFQLGEEPNMSHVFPSVYRICGDFSRSDPAAFWM